MPEHSGDALVTEEDREGPQVSPGSGLTTRKEQKGPRRTTEMSVFRPPSGQGPRTSRIVDIGAKPEQSKLEQQMAEICLNRMTWKSYLPPHPQQPVLLSGRSLLVLPRGPWKSSKQRPQSM